MKNPFVAQSIVFVVDDDPSIREALESLFDVGRIAGRAHAAHAGSRRCRPKYGTGHTSALVCMRLPASQRVATGNDRWVSNFDQFCVGLHIKLTQAATSHIGSPPRLAEDVVCFAPVFSLPGARATR
jgi:hypothetical protein